MITEFVIRRFKSYLQGRLRLASLTLLLGANASGKSNALEALRFLSWLASGRRLGDIVDSVQETDVQIRGAMGDLVHPQGRSFEFECRTDDRTWPQLRIELGIREGGLRIVGEEIVDPQETVPLYTVTEEAAPFSSDLKVRYNNFARGGKKPLITATDQQAVFTQLTTPARFGGAKSQRVIPQVTDRFRKLLDDVLFLDPSPRLMRGYSFVNQRQLKGDGSNLSSVLYDLCIKQRQADEVLRFIQALPEQNIRGIDFTETPRNEVMVRLTESFGDKSLEWDAPSLSDGTLRVLAVAAALLTAPAGSLVIIEEIDNGVHPSRASYLLERIEGVARERSLQVLLSTHNPALVDALPARAVPDVVFCYRDPEGGDSRLVQLEDLERYPELVAQGLLGQLMTRGVLDRFVKDPRTEEERRRESLRWLDNLDSVAS